MATLVMDDIEPRYGAGDLVAPSAPGQALTHRGFSYSSVFTGQPSPSAIAQSLLPGGKRESGTCRRQERRASS